MPFGVRETTYLFIFSVLNIVNCNIVLIFQIPAYRCMVGQVRSTPIIQKVPHSWFKTSRRIDTRGLSEK